ncbi:TetR/AcrR family transcriptional regulator C-terminal domain-containing protein [Streptomyces lydicus]|uniref:TetR/AcrR family transcriptional regulator C-terminal domain-containing protein n=1 Tax=Streptomyces lydicus TaxID=47763 RepID=UPI0033F6C9E8
MSVHDVARALPAVPALRALCRSTAMAEEVLTTDADRRHGFNSRWSETEAPLHHTPWPEGIAAYARGYRRVFQRHPNAIALVARRGVRTEGALQEYDTLLGTLIGAGCDPALAAETAAALDFLVIGSALETYTAGFTRPPAAYRPAYPALADSLEAAARIDPAPTALDDRGFEFGLRMILGGLAQQLDAARND